MAGLLEREELLAALAAEATRGGRLVFLGGEAGVGKTALVRAFVAQSAPRVLQGSCENLATPIPLGPFADVAARTEGALAELLAAGADARRVARALLDELARPAVVVLEDVHWADEATLDALRVLGRRVDDTRGLVVATYRDDEVDTDHPLRAVLGELASAPGVARLSVPRLSLGAVRTIAGATGADGDAVYALTGGNAFFVTEVLAVDSAPLPETVRDAVLARTAQLGAAARRLLDIAALVPGKAELPLLEAVAPDELDQLDSCLAAGVLREDGHAVAFRHELARLALEDSVPAGRRRRLHAALLQGLQAAAPAVARDPARLAHHAERAGDTAAVLEYAPEAARRAAAAASHREAAQQYARALRFAGGLADRERARPPRPLRARGAADRAVSRGGRCVAGGDRAPSHGRRPAGRGPQPRVADEGLHPARPERRGGGGEPGGDRGARVGRAGTRARARVCGSGLRPHAEPRQRGRRRVGHAVGGVGRAARRSRHARLRAHDDRYLAPDGRRDRRRASNSSGGA